MYRTPTTTVGAGGGSQETAAGTTAGALCGRFGERRVSAAPETPRPGPGQGRGTTTEVASSLGLPGATAMPQLRPGQIGPARPSPPAFRPPPGPRADPGAAGITLGSATDTPGTSSGACAAGDVRDWHGILPEPCPAPNYRSYWEAFVRWCKENNAEYWPASPETVAEHLIHRAESCSLGTLYAIRSAIVKTHGTHGYDHRFKKGVVAATLKELASARGEVRSKSKSIDGSSLNAAELDKIRKAALAPRRRGRGYECTEGVTRRARVDLALCSLVLEAGLGCEQAAALEWRDLVSDAKERPAVAIRNGVAGADKVIDISGRAHDDLLAIAPECADAGKWIFGLDAMQIADRIRAAARVAGLESRIVDTGPRLAAHGVTAGLSAHTVSTRAAYWRLFCDWCARNGKDSLPARAETVAGYLREGSGASRKSTIESRRYVIREKHLKAGLDDPCATPLVEATMREIRRLSNGFKPKSLDPAALGAIRATAMEPRLTGNGRESRTAARVRGLADIALCSVLYAARLSIGQAMDLKWRDVEIPRKDEARLTVKSGTDLYGSAIIRGIAGQAVRDLEAIRGDARPEDSVFGFSSGKGCSRVNDAARAAGLLQPCWPSTAGPSPVAQAGPSRSSWDSTPDTSP